MTEVTKAPIKLEDAKPGDFIQSPHGLKRILEITDSGKRFKVRSGRQVMEIAREYNALPHDVFIWPAIAINKRLIPGMVYDYDYCRGSEYTGRALCRGVDGFECWLWMIDGDNHFSTPSGSTYKNFVITNDIDFKMISVEEDLKLGNF